MIDAVEDHEQSARDLRVGQRDETVAGGLDELPRLFQEEAGARGVGSERDSRDFRDRPVRAQERLPLGVRHFEKCLRRKRPEQAAPVGQRRAGERRLHGDERAHVREDFGMQYERGVDVERPFALAEEHHRCRLFGDRVADARGVVAQLAVGGVDLDLARPKRPPDAPQVRRIDAGEDARHQQHRHGRLRR